VAHENQHDTLRIGIAGLGRAGVSMLPAFIRHPGIDVVAAARPDGFGLDTFARDFSAATYSSVAELCDDSAVDAVYIATPTQLHEAHAVIAAEAGKHILLEKPMATSMIEAQSIINAAKKNMVKLVVGHSHSFDPPVREIRKIIATGRLGPVKMIHNWYYSDWFYRPRRPDELDSSCGGGVAMRQGAHQFDIIRYLGGGMVQSVRAATGSWDPARPGQGSHTVFLEFVDGAAATAVYSGYDRFPSYELTFGVMESGEVATADTYGEAAKRLMARRSSIDEVAVKNSQGYTGLTSDFENKSHQGFFGLTLVSCARGDIRQSPDGLTIYGESVKEEVTFPMVESPRDVVAREFYDCVLADQVTVHDGRWGLATLEVCLAVLESARTRKEVYLSHQVPVYE